MSYTDCAAHEFKHFKHKSQQKCQCKSARLRFGNEVEMSLKEADGDTAQVGFDQRVI